MWLTKFARRLRRSLSERATATSECHPDSRRRGGPSLIHFIAPFRLCVTISSSARCLRSLALAARNCLPDVDCRYRDGAPTSEDDKALSCLTEIREQTAP